MFQFWEDTSGVNLNQNFVSLGLEMIMLMIFLMILGKFEVQNPGEMKTKGRIYRIVSVI